MGFPRQCMASTVSACTLPRSIRPELPRNLQMAGTCAELKVPGQGPAETGTEEPRLASTSSGPLSKRYR